MRRLILLALLLITAALPAGTAAKGHVVLRSGRLTRRLAGTPLDIGRLALGRTRLHIR